jgi:hypothetical protein
MRTPRTLLWIVVLLTSSGCGRYLVDTPVLLQRLDPQEVYANCPRDCQTADAAILYATDRSVDEVDGKPSKYGYGRSTRLAFGEANVSLDPEPTWLELVKDSTRAKRERSYELKLASVQEAGRFRSTVTQMLINSDGPQITQATARQEEIAADQLRELLRGRLYLRAWIQ